MNERKVYKVPEKLECKCITEDSETRVYLSAVYKEKGKAGQIISEVIAFALKLFYAAAVTYKAGAWAIEYAYRERGYKAIGSEYMFIALVFGISFYSIHHFFNNYKGGTASENNCKRRN